MEKVAKHHGIKFASAEFEGSEVPGSRNEPTFYVTHLREPVSIVILQFLLIPSLQLCTKSISTGCKIN
jgi:hypothetical protein